MLAIRSMTFGDIPLGVRLKDQAGWNQLEADWRRLLDLEPDGCFVAEWRGVAVGTVTTCQFGSVAWVAMMLVDEAYRGRGIARGLMNRALEELDTRGVISVRLDATPRGRPLYESLGFVAETTFDRYQGVPPPAERLTGLLESRSNERLGAVIALDRDATGTDRGRLIRRLVEEDRGSLRVVEAGEGIGGYLMTRAGSNARQIGPCIADEVAGPALFNDARSRFAGESVVVDVPTVNDPASVLVGSWGLRAERVLVRMGRGVRVVEDLSRIWAGSGPEKG